MWGRGGANIQLNNNRKRRYKNNKKHYKNEYRNNTTTTATTTTTTITIMTMNKQHQQQQKTQRNELTNKLGNKHQKWVRARENLAATGRVYARARTSLAHIPPANLPASQIGRAFRRIFGRSLDRHFCSNSWRGREEQRGRRRET